MLTTAITQVNVKFLFQNFERRCLISSSVWTLNHYGCSAIQKGQLEFGELEVHLQSYCIRNSPEPDLCEPDSDEGANFWSELSSSWSYLFPVLFI